MPVKVEVSEKLTGEWQIGLFSTPCMAPGSWCFGCCCPCCMAAMQRNDILEITGEEYVCCGGLCPCGPLGSPQAKECVWLEAFCCNGLAIAANRFLVQTRFDRQNTACDDCILWVTCIVSWGVCIAQIFMDVPDELERIVDCLVCTVQGCMLAQQKVEIDHIRQVGYNGPPSAIMGMLPPTQQQMISSAHPGGAGAQKYGRN
mmetsp:Transcript_52384/g.125131  ORF Transcript_52384/g.125131 Transcript_52384/m.125131 type:complete len:202 (-) Transcript_52384:254-859(-)|eukprot:CAMPEP_0178408334 /NCGR_PEP_ID=MMETSP0689_2-20121128/19886_1 /TAXON_ID=160604 /ORGANISM="Amphidinium massartii, Strain CS-259" /LENGTH=201 /DNA_ID=CAMNT_0020029427 /DNA_START=50 /DNA_END=655 /DNA_ORIENTATION=+